MSTRGFVGFVIDGNEKIAYNHSDSYPAGLGLAVLHWAWVNQHSLTCDIHRGEQGGPVDLARRLRVVDPDSKPTAEDIERLKGYANTNVGIRALDDWYVLLRETQGNPGAMLAAGVIADGSKFPTDSLFAEYGYIVDLDAQVFEAYAGFQREPHDKGRFASRPPHDASPGYHPAALVASWPLDSLPSDDAVFVEAVEGKDEDAQGGASA